LVQQAGAALAIAAFSYDKVAVFKSRQNGINSAAEMAGL